MNTNSIIIFLACVIVIAILGKIFLLPIKKILKLIINSILGGVLIFVINLIGQNFNFQIGLNIITSIFVGILGIPRSSTFDFIKNYYIKSHKYKFMTFKFVITLLINQVFLGIFVIA